MSQRLPSRSRPRLYLSVRSLFLLVGIVAIWLAIEVNRARRQQRAVEAIRILGGHVQYDFQQDRHSSLIPSWLRSRIGHHFFSRVVSADFRGSSTADRDLPHIADLRNLERLNLSETAVTEHGIVHLAHLRGLKILSLNDTALSNAGLGALRGLTELQWLELNNTNITDAGLVNLRGMSNLESLWLNDNRISDDGLVHLSALGKLRSLALRSTRVGDRGLRQLLTIPKLQSLDLSDSEITQHATQEARTANVGITLVGP